MIVLRMQKSYNPEFMKFSMMIFFEKKLQKSSLQTSNTKIRTKSETLFLIDRSLKVLTESPKTIFLTKRSQFLYKSQSILLHFAHILPLPFADSSKLTQKSLLYVLQCLILHPFFLTYILI